MHRRDRVLGAQTRLDPAIANGAADRTYLTCLTNRMHTAPRIDTAPAMMNSG
jgi:hypothetical protein